MMNGGGFDVYKQIFNCIETHYIENYEKKSDMYDVVGYWTIESN